MPPILSNGNRDGTVVIRSLSDETFSMSDFATAQDTANGVVVSDASIRRILFSTDGNITIGRVVNNSTNAVMYSLQYSCTFDLSGMGVSTNSALDFSQCNLYITHSSANSVAILQLKKHTVPQGETP